MADYRTFKDKFKTSDDRISYLLQMVRPSEILKPLLWDMDDNGGLDPIHQTEHSGVFGSAITRDQIEDYCERHNIPIINKVVRTPNSVGYDGNWYSI